MTKATSETTKLNFITDQGSTRATVRWACRALRFDFPFCGAFRIVTGPSPAVVLPAPVLARLAVAALAGLAAEAAVAEAEAAVTAAASFPVVPDRRKDRAGDDGESGGGSGGGSGISHANAADDTDGGSAGAGGTLDDGRPEGAAPEDSTPEDPTPEDAEREKTLGEKTLGEASSSNGFPADPAGSAVAGAGSKLNAGGSATGDCSPALLAVVSLSGSFPFGLMPRAAPMLSAGRAGTPSAMVASAAPGKAASLTVAGLPLGPASLPPLADASLAPSIPFPAAGAPLAAGPASGVPSDAASSGGPDLAGADLAAVGRCGDRLGGAMMPLGCVSCSLPIRSSPVALDVTTVGEPPPEPSGLSVRLSKPSSL